MWAPLAYEVESIQNSSRLKNDTNLYDIFHETRDLLEGRNIPIYPFFGLIFLEDCSVRLIPMGKDLINSKQLQTFAIYFHFELSGGIKKQQMK